MSWKEYLRSQGYTDAEISKMETEFGGDKMSKAFATPMQQLADATKALNDAKTEREEFDNWYQSDVLPKLGQTYQDAINARTENAALKARLAAATEYGFLKDDKAITGVVPGASPNPNPAAAAQSQVPGSPAAPGAPAFDPNQFVRADKFVEQVNNIPSMLGRLTKISNEHHALFGSPLLDIDTLISEAQASKGKRTVVDLWEEKYKVKDKRAQIEQEKQAAHDRQIADEAVRKYASEHNMPFTAPGQVSRAPLFTPKNTDEARHPWQGARDRKQERKQTMLEAIQNKGGGATTRVQ